MPNRTALYDTHIALGAKCIDFGGWEMPVEYPSKILQEHHATRSAAGLFDTGHMGELLVEGPGAFESLQALVSRDLSGMEDGQGRYTLLMTPQGTVLDDLIIFKQADNQYYVVTNAGTREGDAAQIKSGLKNATMTDLTPQTQKLDLQGPKTYEILAKLSKAEPKKLKRFRWTKADVAGVPSIISKSGYTGEANGVELFFPKEKAQIVWAALMEAGKPFGMLPCGLGARDTLRLECCLPLYGHELSTEITPLEAGLDWAVSLEKNFLGVEVLRKQKEQGVTRRLVALKVEGRQPPRAEYAVLSGDRKVGVVKSGGVGPSVNHPCALAFVESALASPGTKLQIEARANRLDAVVVEPPFYKPKKG
ncbi:MAG TPA: glycine cleavage system aminomethyltransferase GcvT [Planctomycetota bacterium]|nr:glycine cleavage system aminomethyltransferase GcvT [Planctomycetota bacterium]